MARTWILASSITLALIVPQADCLELGDPAPVLHIAEWHNGDPVDLTAGDDRKIFVLHFWATWSGRSRMALSQLARLQKKLDNDTIEFIGITEESPAVVRPIISDMAKRLTFPIAVDDLRKTTDSYMAAYEAQSFPQIFVVDTEGILVWHGSQVNALEPILNQLQAGTYDLESAKNLEAMPKLATQFLDLVMEGEDKAKADELGKLLLEIGSEFANSMNNLAWTLLVNPNVKYRDLDLAMRFAQAAYDATEGKAAHIADTYARAFFETGDIEKAIEIQKDVVEINKEPRMAQGLEKTLGMYQEALENQE